MYNFQTWVTSDFVPKDDQIVVVLAITGQMLLNRVWLGKYKPSVHSRSSPDPVRPCTTDRTGIPKSARHSHGNVRAYEHPYANRAWSVVTVRAGSVRIYKHHTEPVRGLQEQWTVVLKAEPYGAVRTHTGHLRARTWLIGLCPVWDPIGNLHDPLRLSTSLVWSQNRRKPVSEICASSTFSYSLYDAHSGLNIFEKSCRYACRGITHRFSSFWPVWDPWTVRELDLVANYDSRSYKSHRERERRRWRESDSERETMPYCLIRVSLSWSLKSYIFRNEPMHDHTPSLPRKIKPWTHNELRSAWSSI